MKKVENLKRTKILNYVQAHGPMTRTEIQKFIKVDLNGHSDFNPVKDRGYYCDAFWAGSYYYLMGRPNWTPLLTAPRSYDRRYLAKNADGLYEVLIG